MPCPPLLPTRRSIELRQYTLHPGQRDVLIELFEREFVETQEAPACACIGHFRDLDGPDRFVWLRGFADMAARAPALAAFYGGPAWASAPQRRQRDDDRLRRRAAAASRPHAAPASAAAQAAPQPGSSLAAICPFVQGTCAFTTLRAVGSRRWRVRVRSCRPRHGAGANNFPRLPVREGEPVFVLAVAAVSRRAALPSIGRATHGVRPWLAAAAAGAAPAPTARSRAAHLHGDDDDADFIGTPHDFDFLVGALARRQPPPARAACRQRRLGRVPRHVPGGRSSTAASASTRSAFRPRAFRAARCARSTSRAALVDLLDQQPRRRAVPAGAWRLRRRSRRVLRRRRRRGPAGAGALRLDAAGPRHRALGAGVLVRRPEWETNWVMEFSRASGDQRR